MNRRRKGRIVSVVAVGLVALVALGSAALLSPSAVRATSHCGGTERWDVKTLTDAANPTAGSLRYSAKDTTIDRLREQVLPESIGGYEPRLPGVETQVWRLRNVYLVDARLVRGGSPPGDEDIHLVIRDRHLTHTMIVEFPDIRCRGASVSHKKARIEAARNAFLEACGGVPRSFVGTAAEPHSLESASSTRSMASEASPRTASSSIRSCRSRAPTASEPSAPQRT